MRRGYDSEFGVSFSCLNNKKSRLLRCSLDSPHLNPTRTVGRNRSARATDRPGYHQQPTVRTRLQFRHDEFRGALSAATDEKVVLRNALEYAGNDVAMSRLTNSPGRDRNSAVTKKASLGSSGGNTSSETSSEDENERFSSSSYGWSLT